MLCNISENQFEKLLRSALRDNYFLFDGIIYQQIDGVAMRSTLDPTISFKIFWDFSMFYQIFLSPQVKRWAIITYKHVRYELPHQLSNDLRVRILGN